MIKIQRFRFNIKDITETGTFEGLLSPFGNVDEGGDVVEPGAFTKTLQDQGPKRPLLWQHRPDLPIGELTLEERSEGLWAKGSLLMELQLAKDAHLLMKRGVVTGMSMGFRSVKDFIEKGVRHLKEVKLYEGSVVTFPMNDLARVMAVKRAQKAEQKGDFNEELNDIQVLQSMTQMQDALWAAISSVIWQREAERAGKVKMATTIIEQFAESFTDFFPQYLDVLEARWGPMENWSQEEIEKKAGAVLSAANKTLISSALGKIKTGHDDLRALVAEGAEEDEKQLTPEEQQAAEKSDDPPEPVQDHSAAKSTLDEIVALIPA